MSDFSDEEYDKLVEYLSDQNCDEIEKEKKIKLLKENIKELEEKLKLLELQD